MFGNSDKRGSTGFSEAGVNILSRINNRNQFSAQLLSRRAGEGNEGEPNIDYLLLDTKVVTTTKNTFGVRIGRIKNPLGLYMETRDVVFTRPSILLPQSIYFDRTRNLGLSADTLHIYHQTIKNNDEIISVIGAGYPNDVSDENTMAALIGQSANGDIKGGLSGVGRVMLLKDGGDTVLALSLARLNIEYIPSDIDIQKYNGNITTDFIFLSYQRNTNDFSFTTEYATRLFKYTDVDYIPTALQSFRGESGYVQLEYHLNNNIRTHLRYDVVYLNTDDRNGRMISELTNGARPYHSQFAKDFSTGVRWEITQNSMIMAEHHWVDGTAWLANGDNPDVAKQSRYWNLFMLMFAVKF
jgi:hypothetical protein